MSRTEQIRSLLRSTMTDEWLNVFMLMSVEKYLVDNPDMDIIIRRFAESSTQNEAIVIFATIDIIWLHVYYGLYIVISTDNG